MLENILEIIKTPVTTMIEKSNEEDLKKGAIKALILSIILSVITTLTKVVIIIKNISKKSYYKDYTSSELWEQRIDTIKNAELFSSFFKQIVIYLIIIALAAAILFVIAKILKKAVDYAQTVSLINSTFLLYIIGSILNVIISLIYAPLGALVMLTFTIYISLSLIHAFKEILEDVDVDNLVLVTTGVIISLIIILLILAMVLMDISFKDLSGINQIFKLN